MEMESKTTVVWANWAMCETQFCFLLPLPFDFFFQTRRAGEEGLGAGLVDISGALLPSRGNHLVSPKPSTVFSQETQKLKTVGPVGGWAYSNSKLCVLPFISEAFPDTLTKARITVKAGYRTGSCQEIQAQEVGVEPLPVQAALQEVV